MSYVTVIGLGAMGSALAQGLMDASYVVTVWNRSPEKIEMMIANGASGAASVAAAEWAAMPARFPCGAYEAPRPCSIPGSPPSRRARRCCPLK